MEQKFIKIGKWEEWTVWNNWLYYCTLKNIPMIKIYKKRKYSIVDWDYTSISKEKLVLEKNREIIEEFFVGLWKKYQIKYSRNYLSCMFEEIPNENAENLAIEIYDFLNNLIIKK